MKLRKLAYKDIPYMLEWMLDPEITQYFRFDASKATEVSVRAFIDGANASERDLHYAVVDDQDEYLGTASLKNVDQVSRNAELALAFRQKAISSGAARFGAELLVKKAFDELSLEKIYMNVLSYNTRCLRFCERMGFVREGEFKKHIMIDGKLQGLTWFAGFKEGQNV